jgi:hypothetical protein
MSSEEKRRRLMSKDSLVLRQSYALTVSRTQALKQQLYDRYNESDRSFAGTPDSASKEIEVIIPPEDKFLGKK